MKCGTTFRRCDGCYFPSKEKIANQSASSLTNNSDLRLTKEMGPTKTKILNIQNPIQNPTRVGRYESKVFQKAIKSIPFKNFEGSLVGGKIIPPLDKTNRRKVRHYHGYKSDQ